MAETGSPIYLLWNTESITITQVAVTLEPVNIVLSATAAERDYKI